MGRWLEATRATILAVGLILATMFGLQLSSSVQESQSWDEAVHLAAGVSYWRTGDFRMNPEHPPLVKLLAALPLLPARVSLPLSDESWAAIDEWRFGKLFLYENRLSPQTLLLLGRLPGMLLSLLLGLLIFKVSRRMFGTVGGLLSLSLFAFDPNITAHSRFITTDLGFTTTAFWTLLRLQALLERPHRQQAILFGLALVVTGLTKFSGAAFLLVIIGLGLLLKLHTPNHPVFRWRSIWRFTLLFIPAAWLLTWSVYAFDLRSPDNDPRIARLEVERQQVIAEVPRDQMPSLQRFAVETLGDSSHGIGAWLERMKHGTYPTYTFFRGLTAVVSHATGGHSTFALGMHSKTGWWWYFPFAFIAKTPLPTIIGLVGLGSLAWVAVRRERKVERSWLVMYRSIDRRWILFLGMPILFMGIAMAGNLNLGWRHIMPIYPPLLVLIGALVKLKLPGPTWRQYFIPLILIVNIAFVQISSFPNFMGYFSPIVGGSFAGPRLLQDSNLDWGQDLPKLAKYVREQKLDRLPFAYYGEGRVQAYVPQAVPLPTTQEVLEQGQPVGIVAISVGQLYLPEAGYTWLWSKQPVRRIGSSIFIYDLK